MIDWKKMKSDISKGLKDGFETVKDGAGTVAKKAEELSIEGQKKYKAFNLKKHIQDQMEELGVVLYNAEKETPGTIKHDKASEIVKKIDKSFEELKDLEKE